MQKINNTSSLFRSDMIKEGVKIKLIRSYQGDNSNTNGNECTIISGNNTDGYLISDPSNSRKIREYFEGLRRCEAVIYTDFDIWKDSIPSLESKVISLEQELENLKIKISKAKEEVIMHTNFESEEEYLASKLIEVMSGTKDLKVVTEIIKTMKNTNLL